MRTLSSLILTISTRTTFQLFIRFTGTNKLKIPQKTISTDSQSNMTNSKVPECPEENPKPNPFKINLKLVQARERDAFDVVNTGLQHYKPTEMMVAFNGGKDCTVVLHLLAMYYQQRCLEHIRIPVLYIKPEHSFEEIEQVLEECVKIYNIEMITRCGDIKTVLSDVCAEMPFIKAIFMGCRRMDPYCEDMLPMQATDAGWPALMRINPIIDWTCFDVWNYIFANDVPYCSLYDKGYTSLGNKKNTIRNPYLKKKNPATGAITYGPAYEIADQGDLERAGRL